MKLDIEESSLNRVMSKDKKGGMAIMSTQRGDKSEREQVSVLSNSTETSEGKG